MSNSMRQAVTKGRKMDLVEPFPESGLAEVHHWLHAARVIATTGEFPKELPLFLDRIRETLPSSRSWGVLDRADMALIGIVIVQPAGLMGFTSYIASARRAWGKGLMDEAARLVMAKLFADPSVNYIQGLVLDNNHPSRAFSERIGLRLKNILPQHTLQNGKLRDLLVYEIARNQWAQ